MPVDASLSDVMRRIVGSRFADREFALDYWTRERLFSVEARRVWVDPDIKPFDFNQCAW